MSFAESRSQALLEADRSSVITNSILLTRRIRELQRRRQALVSRQEQVRAQLPDWAVEPLRLVGMTNEFMEMAGGGNPEMAGGPAMVTPNTNAPLTSVSGGRGGPFNAQSELMAELMTSQGSLRELAEQTGGIASVNTNSLTTAFNQIVQANSRYYVLGYYPPTQARDGRFHTIDVRAKRPGLRVTARRGYASPRGRTPAERQAVYRDLFGEHQRPERPQYALIVNGIHVVDHAHIVIRILKNKQSPPTSNARRLSPSGPRPSALDQPPVPSPQPPAPALSSLPGLPPRAAGGAVQRLAGFAQS